jgi:hypothetical protein|tara:strand:- start:215 stop:400 length:186 start_codon:yes stop_codon:yes gene_type:complete
MSDYEASNEHNNKVMDLTIFDLMNLDNENLLIPELKNKLDDLYYALLDDVKIKNHLKKDKN